MQTKIASRQKMLALKNAVTQLFEEAHAHVNGYVDKDLLFQVIHDGDRHPILHCSFGDRKKEQLNKQIGHVKAEWNRICTSLLLLLCTSL